MWEQYIYKYLLKSTSKFTNTNKIFFFKELSYLIEGGVSILESLKVIKENTDNYVLISICTEIYSSLKKGETLSRSLTKLPNYFNEADVNIIRGGENSGELIKVLQYLSNEYEFLNEIRQKYFAAMLYPTIVFLVSLIAIYVIITQVLPGIFSLVSEFEGFKLPWTTSLLLAICNFVTTQYGTIAIILGFGLIGFLILISHEEGRKYIDKLLIQMPILGKITKYYFLIRFFRYLNLFLTAGMNYVDTFQSLKKIMDNYIYKLMINDILVAIRKGQKILDALKNYEIIIPKDVILLLKVGEESASISTSIRNAIGFYETEFNKTLDNLSKTIEPILLTFVGAIIGFIAISVFSIIGNIIDSVQIG